MSDQRTIPENELQILEALEQSPHTTQADLAAQVGVAVGTVNWYLKRWSRKGYVKVRRIGRWQWSYLLTPEGMARKAQLAAKYVDASMALYRRTRADAQQLLGQVQCAGYDRVYVEGDSEIGEICRLTCLERGVLQAERPEEGVPVVQVNGTQLTLRLPQDAGHGAQSLQQVAPVGQAIRASEQGPALRSERVAEDT